MDIFHQLANQGSSVAKPLLPGRTLIEVVGKNRIVVEHHSGIYAYSNREIRLGASFGTISIQGESLQLGCMSHQMLCITGRVIRIEFLEGRV